MEAYMSTRNSIVLLGIIGLVACSTRRPEASAPASGNDIGRALSQQNVDAVIYQHSSAEVYRLYQQCFELAHLRLLQNLDRPHDKPPAVVVDIDETVLDNSPFQMTNVAQGRTYTPKNWSDWTARAEAKATPGSVEFLNDAARKGCQIFYITNRSAAEQAATIRNLRALSFPTVDEKHVLCMDGNDTDKTKRREQVRTKWFIALLVGDQLRDYDERFKDRAMDNGRPMVDAMRDSLSTWFIMLPNPMYGTWLDAVSGKTDSVKVSRKSAWFDKESR